MTSLLRHRSPSSSIIKSLYSRLISSPPLKHSVNLTAAVKFSSSPSPSPSKAVSGGLAAEDIVLDDEDDEYVQVSGAVKTSTIPTLLQPRVVVYDGVCHLCHRVVGPVDEAAKSDRVLDILATPSSYEIVYVDYTDEYVVPPPWLDYTGKWGPTKHRLWKEEAKIAIKLFPCLFYYKLLASVVVEALPQALFGQDGPAGPKMKPSWDGDESE